LGFVLILKGPNKKVQEYQLADGETSVGRDPANALVLDGRGVSRRHAKFQLKKGRLSLTDLGSTYGTRVNDVITMQRDLADGDTITVGMHYLLVKEVPDVGPANSGKLTTLAPDSQGGFNGDDVTQAPSPSDVHKRKTLQMNRQAIQFILDNPDEDGRAVQVLSKEDSSLMKAVERLGAAADFGVGIQDTQPSQSADYQALLLMYKVSELLVAANDLDEFVEPVADLVMESVNATTVVLLMLGEGGELEPRVIRHHTTLREGEIPVSRGIVDRVIAERIAVMSNDVGHDSRLEAGKSVMLYNICAVMAFPLSVHGELRGVLYLSRSVAKPFTVADGDLVAALAALVASGMERAELRSNIVQEKQQRKALERFHPPEVVDQLFSTGVGEASLQEHRATALVCDLAGFNKLVGLVEPRKLAVVLHEYYELIYDKVFANGGSLVKLLDGWALALFGTPHSPDPDAVWAVEAARMLCREFKSLVTLWPGGNSLSLRCALDSGSVVAGVVGSVDRMEYTAIGTPISTAATVVRQVGETSVLFTERTWAELPKKRYRVEAVSQAGDVTIYRLDF
jgi:class 3 adenylate cyclase